MANEEATTYVTFVTFGSGYKLEDHNIIDEIREALEGSKGQLVDSYAPVGPWDAMIVADFPTNQNAIEFRQNLKQLGMWKVESTPTGTVASLNKISKVTRGQEVSKR